VRLLVLGGTVFLGRHVVDAALAAGDEVTIFNRGRTAPGLFPETERLRGDRASDLGALAGREWDAVIDTSGFVPSRVGASASALSGSAGLYVFVSSASAYADWPARPVDEDSPTWPTGPDAGRGDGDYGELKAGCERAAEQAMPGRVLHVRPGTILGPYENVGRLPFWLERVVGGGEVTAPGRPDRPLQAIDARDLAAWMLAMTRPGRAGVFNANSPPGAFTTAELLEACRDATGGEPTFVWTPDADVLATGVEPWTELPLWIQEDEENRGVWSMATERAQAAGLTCRPIADTARDTWAWLRAGD
jgi:2'-hydroxyisoflavone reductase